MDTLFLFRALRCGNLILGARAYLFSVMGDQEAYLKPFETRQTVDFLGRSGPN